MSTLNMSKIIWPVVTLLSLSACDNNSNVRITTKQDAPAAGLKVISALQCPTEQGVLTRRGTATDVGNTCVYVGPRGADVKLHLVELNDETAKDILKRYQDELSLTPTPNPPAVTVHTETTDSLTVEDSGEKATVKLPGLKIEADGDRANIRIGGLVIRADDSGAQVSATNGDDVAVITANDSGANINASSSQSGALRSSMLNVSSKTDSNGWRVVGYEARGPEGGPVVIATFRLRDRDDDDIVEAVKALVTLNVGD